MSTGSSSPMPAKSWNPVVGVIVALGALFVSQFIIGLVLSVYPYIRGWSSAKANSWLSGNIAIEFIFVLLAESLTVYLIYLYLKRYQGAFAEIGIRRPRWLDPLLGLIALPAYFLLYLAVLTISTKIFPGLNTTEKQQLGFSGAHGTGNLILTFISLVILPPIGEELVFRGLIYSSLKKLMPIWIAVILTSLLFAAGHLPEGGSAGPLYIGAIDTFSLSLVLIYLREKTHGLWASMTLHALKNAIAFVALFALHIS